MEQQIDKHKRLIAALGEKVDAIKVAHQDWDLGADEEKVARQTSQRAKKPSPSDSE